MGVGVGMAKDRDGTAGLAALVSWLMIITLLNADFLAKVLSSVVSNEVPHVNRVVLDVTTKPPASVEYE